MKNVWRVCKWLMIFGGALLIIAGIAAAWTGGDTLPGKIAETGGIFAGASCVIAYIAALTSL